MIMKSSRRFLFIVSMLLFLVGAVSVTLLQAEVEAWKTELVSLSSDGEAADGIAKNPAISGDGRYVVFDSQAKNLVPNDTNNTTDVLLHDRQTRETVRVSVSSYGTQGNGTSYNPSISRNDQYIAFASGTSSFSGDDTNGTCHPQLW